MERRFHYALEFRFDEVIDKGFSRLAFDEMTRWFDRQRITKGIWQDIEERWHERSQEPLFVAQQRDGYLLVWGAGLTSSASAWLQPISKFTQAGEEA